LISELSDNVRFLKDSSETYILVNSREAKAIRLLKNDKDYYKDLSDSLRTTVRDLNDINGSLVSENLLYSDTRDIMQEIIDRERSYNLFTNEELKIYKNAFRKQKLITYGVGGGSAVVIGGILYVTLGPHTRK
jgi:hypothetical protein